MQHPSCPDRTVRVLIEGGKIVLRVSNPDKPNSFDVYVKPAGADLIADMLKDAARDVRNAAPKA